MPSDDLATTIFLIFTGAAVLATVALFLRQSLLIAYIALGLLIGPSGLGLVEDPEDIRRIAGFGVMFLLFLLGLNMYPQKLVQLARETTLVTGASSLVFALLGWGAGRALGYTQAESLVLGAALTFSSTILGLKLLPTTVLHHRRTGEVIISILLLQDLVAIAILVWIEWASATGLSPVQLVLHLAALPGAIAFALLFARYALIPLIARFDAIQEYVFLVALGWCLGLAELAHFLGLSHEVGAFIAGVALATSRIADFIADHLRPLRDFFLVLFFFSLGAGFDLRMLHSVWLPAIGLTVLVLVLKPPVFRGLLRLSGEASGRATEVGLRLGQISEFSLFIALAAERAGIIDTRMSYLIQTATLLSFVVSGSLIVTRCPTPIALSERLRRD